MCSLRGRRRICCKEQEHGQGQDQIKIELAYLEYFYFVLTSNGQTAQYGTTAMKWSLKAMTLGLPG